ncbi:MAG TPA: PEP-CTERM sorting domain-containing protein [Opitutaceae bacterium]|nr:PEP-CTERM sorting domain-containing protein [Opitutaceae bacterium]
MIRLLAILSVGLVGAAAQAQTTVFSENFEGRSSLPFGWHSYLFSDGPAYLVGDGMLQFTQAANGGGLATRAIDLSSLDLNSPVTLSFSYSLSSFATDAFAIGFGTDLSAAGPSSWVYGWNDPDSIALTQRFAGSTAPATATFDISSLLTGRSEGELQQFRVFFIPRLPSAIGGNSVYDFGTVTIDNVSVSGTVAVPEPSTYAALFGVASLGVVAWRRRLWRAAQQ